MQAQGSGRVSAPLAPDGEKPLVLVVLPLGSGEPAWPLEGSPDQTTPRIKGNSQLYGVAKAGPCRRETGAQLEYARAYRVQTVRSPSGTRSTVLKDYRNVFFQMSNWATRYTRAGPKPCCEGNTVSKKYGDYLNTEYWAKVSNLVKERAGWRCQICNSPHDLNAHHRTYEHRGDELRHLDDLIAMCRRCHAIFHGKLETTIVQVPAPPATVGKRAPKWSKGGPIDAEWVKASHSRKQRRDHPYD